ncbi:MAG TPA: hypothetical protein VD838_18585 [Anaeromyxobacteraceae bacterium]|nr:hypothetical protein [Anaeromyxobacteraceae bacterium]
MSARAHRPLGVAALLLALALPFGTAAAEDEPSRRWFVPDHAKLQLAGDIGFLSPGVGWEHANRKIHVDLFLGWVPEAIGGHDIWSATGKITFTPWRLNRGERWVVQPFSVGTQVTWTFGSEYFVRAPSRYVAGYYEIPTALRAGLTVGAGVARKLRDQRELGLYAELVALDLLVREWIENPDVLGPTDVLSLAIGTRFAF